MSSHYTLANKAAIVKSRIGNLWVEKSISTLPLKEIFFDYRNVEVPVIDFFGNEVTLDLYTYRSELEHLSETIPQWLTRIGSRKLIVSDGHPSLTLTAALYVPVHYNEGSVKLAKRGYHPSHDVTPEDCDDLIVNINGCESRFIFDHSLLSVNGYYFQTDFHDYGVRIMDGGDAVSKSGVYEMGLLSFETIGTITQEPITVGGVFKVDESKSYKDRLHIRTKTNLRNKTVGVVLGGYLHLLDNTVKIVGDNLVSLSLRNINITERVIQSKDTLDLSFMELDNLDNTAVVANHLSEEAYLEYLTCKYSFLVIIDNPEIVTDIEPVAVTAKLGSFIISEKVHHGLLMDPLGRVMEYWPKYECGQWALCTSRDELDNNLIETTDWHALTRMNDALKPSEPKRAIRPKLVQFRARAK